MIHIPRFVQFKLIAVLVIAILFAIPLAQELRDHYASTLRARQTSSTREGPAMPVYVGNSVVQVVVVSTEKAKQKGLGGRTHLDEGEGMLFFFDNEDIYPFWMKDMQFPIDIIWIAADGTIVDMWQNASPDTYPNAYHPRAKSKYVLEVYAGFAQKNNLHEGNMVRFSN
jgi:uncharacterized protein